MKMVVEPDRGKALRFGLLRDASHRFISLYRIGNTHEVQTPSLWSNNTVIHRHRKNPFLTTYVFATIKDYTVFLQTR